MDPSLSDLAPRGSQEACVTQLRANLNVFPEDFLSDRSSVRESHNDLTSLRKQQSYYAIIIHTNESYQEPVPLPEPFIDKVTEMPFF